MAKEAKMSEVEKLAKDFEMIGEKAHALVSAVTRFNLKLEKAGVTSLPGLKSAFILSTFKHLGQSLKRLYSRFPIPEKDRKAVVYGRDETIHD